MTALVCLVDAICNGTTTLVDHHASPSEIDGSLDIITGAVEAAGLRAALCYEVTNHNGPAGARIVIDGNRAFHQLYAFAPVAATSHYIRLACLA